MTVFERASERVLQGKKVAYLVTALQLRMFELRAADVSSYKIGFRACSIWPHRTVVYCEGWAWLSAIH